MFCDSQTGSCKSTEKIWGIINQDKTKLYRLTFSESLAKFICDKDDKYRVERFNFKIGKKLAVGEKSQSGLYAIMSVKGDYALRISLHQEGAQLLCDDKSRYLAEAWII